MDQRELLERYVREKDQAAFAEVVRHHGAWVYSSAHRQLRDAHLAEDVTQAVFVLLAQKAGSAGRCGNVGGWLFNTLRYCVKHAGLERQRRQRREREAAKMRPEISEREADAGWEEISPVLDEAVARLAAKDREAILARFYERRGYAEMGRTMGVSEAAVSKRVQRAVEKLRGMLAKKGVMAGVGTLGVVMAERASAAAPAGLMEAATAAAGGGAAGSAGAIAHGAIKMMAWAKVKAAAIVVMAAGLTIGGVVAGVTSANGPSRVASSPTAAPIATRPASNPAVASAAVKFDWHGVVLDPDNHPVANALVRCWRMRKTVQLELETRTGADGSYVLPGLEVSGPGLDRTVVIDAPGFAYAWANPEPPDLLDMGEPVVRHLTRPLSVSGIVRSSSGQPVEGATVAASAQRGWRTEGYGYWQMESATTDAQGRFTITRVPEKARLHLSVSHDGDATFSTREGYHGDDYPIVAGTADVQVTLQKGGSVRVRLVAGGKKVAKPDVVVCMASVFAVTDTSGEAVVPGLLPGKYHVQVIDRVDDGAWEVRDDAEVQEGAQCLVEAVPRAGQRVSGRMINRSTGEPVANASVSVQGKGTYIGQVDAGSDGQFTVRLPAGRYMLHASGWGDGESCDFQKALTVVAGEDPAPFDWPISVRRNIPGRLSDASGKPVAGWIADASGRTAGHAGTDGVFEIPEPDCGTWPAVCLAVSEDRKLWAGFCYDYRDPSEFRITLQPTASLKGRLVDEQHRPVSNGKVMLWVGDSKDRIFSSLNRPARVTVSADGQFRITGIPMGLATSVRAHANGRQAHVPVTRLRPGQETDVGTIVIRPVGTGESQSIGASVPADTRWDAVIAGRVIGPDGKPVCGASITADVPGGAGRAQDTTDLSGRFRLSNLPANARLRLWMSADSYGSVLMENVATGQENLEWKVQPQGYEWYGKPAPELVVDHWLNGEPQPVK